MREKHCSTLHDDLEKAVLGNFYITFPKISKIILKITKFGSQSCETEIYNKETGKFLIKSKIRTRDTKLYTRIPESELPRKLKEKIPRQTSPILMGPGDPLN